jgi:hypothetical protein
LRAIQAFQSFKLIFLQLDSNAAPNRRMRRAPREELVRGFEIYGIDGEDLILNINL